MTTSARATLPLTDGTAALSLAAPRPALTLVRGGLSERPRRARAAVSPGLSRRQALALAATGAALVLALCAACLASEALASQASSAALAAVPTETVCVLEGDTLWGLAERHGVDGVATQDVMAWIERENGLDGASLEVGGRLVVPAGGSSLSR